MVIQKFKKRCKVSSFRLSVKVKPFGLLREKSSFSPLRSEKSIFLSQTFDCLRFSSLAKKASFFYFFCFHFVLVKNFNTASQRLIFLTYQLEIESKTLKSKAPQSDASSRTAFFIKIAP